MPRFWIFAAISATALTARGAETLHERKWTIDGVSRVALVHVPPDAKAHPTPVVFVFHGHNQMMQHAAAQFSLHTHWPKAIVVYMQGLPRKEGDGPGWQYNPGDEDGRDLKFFDAVLASLMHGYKVDAGRVYAAGFSNGAGFVFVLWAVRGDRLAAVSACAMHAGHNLPLPQPKPLFHIAGKTDPKVKLEHQMHTIESVKKTNECGEGHPWVKGCTIYPSKIGAPVVTMIHGGGHMVPHEAPPLIVKFFKEEHAPAKGEGRRLPP